MGSCVFTPYPYTTFYRTLTVIQYTERYEGTPPTLQHYKRTTITTLSIDGAFVGHSDVTVSEVAVSSAGTPAYQAYYSDVVTDAQLEVEEKAHAAALLLAESLPSWGGIVEGSNQPVSGAERSGGVTLTKSQIRVEHGPSPSCYLKVWIRSNFWNAATETSSSLGVQTYEWNGTGDPCVTDPDLPASHEDNKIIEVTPRDFSPPLEYGWISLEAKYSVTPDFEPDWDDLHYTLLTPGWRP